MNCCEQSLPFGGTCDQGRDCPVRRAQATPASVAPIKALRHHCNEMGVCQHPRSECLATCRLADAVPGAPYTAPRWDGPLHYVERGRDIVAEEDARLIRQLGWLLGGLVGVAFIALLAFAAGVMHVPLAAALQALEDGLANLGWAVARLWS